MTTTFMARRWGEPNTFIKTGNDGQPSGFGVWRCQGMTEKAVRPETANVEAATDESAANQKQWKASEPAR